MRQTDASRMCDALFTFIAIASNRNNASAIRLAITMLQAEQSNKDADPNHAGILKAGEVFLAEELTRTVAQMAKDRADFIARGNRLASIPGGKS